jgi:hypothetical protein
MPWLVALTLLTVLTRPALAVEKEVLAFFKEQGEILFGTAAEAPTSAAIRQFILVYVLPVSADS